MFQESARAKAVQLPLPQPPTPSTASVPAAVPADDATSRLPESSSVNPPPSPSNGNSPARDTRGGIAVSENFMLMQEE